MKSDPIPTFQSSLGWCGEQLTKHGFLALVLIDISPLLQIERLHGIQAYDELLEEIGQVLCGMRGVALRDADMVTVDGEFGEQFLVVLSEKRTPSQFKQENLEIVADRVHIELLSKVYDLTSKYTQNVPALNVGFAAAIHNPMLRPERVIRRMVGDARSAAQHQSYRFTSKTKEQLRTLIHEGLISTVFQPIINLVDHSVLGYEALSRGPAGTPFANPMMLFKIAEQTDLLFELDHLCRKRAITNAKEMGVEYRLFVNTLPSSIHDPGFRGEYVDALMNETKLAPANLVIEVTEALAIESSIRFQDALDSLKRTGFAIGVDDAGTGYSSLDTIAKLKPDFIKVDMSLIRGIDTNPVKKEITRSLLSIANTMGAKLVAEGIEKKEELEALKVLGVPYGQGFLIARPGPAFPAVEIDSVADLSGSPKI